MNEGSNQLGFCASMDEASVRTAINAYALGAKYANPDAKVQVLWADSWYDLDVESQNAKTLIDNGIKYMGMEASSPAVPVLLFPSSDSQPRSGLRSDRVSDRTFPYLSAGNLLQKLPPDVLP